MSPLQSFRDCVAVIDDDDAVREGLCLMLDGLHFDVLSYACASDFLADEQASERCACLVLDVRLPDMSGIELQRQLASRAQAPAIVFISGHADVPIVVEAMRRGAVDFLQKPFSEHKLIDCIQKTLAQSRQNRANRQLLSIQQEKIRALTQREKVILADLVKGFRSKEIAANLQLSPRTVEEHRKNVMHKLGVTTLAELIEFRETILTAL